MPGARFWCAVFFPLLKHVAVTKSLKKLLFQLGWNEKAGSDEYIIGRMGDESVKFMMMSITRGFNHYIKFVTNRELKFKNLRKTYISHLTRALGEKAKMFTGHANDEVLKDHYLSSAYLAGGLSDFSVF